MQSDDLSFNMLHRKDEGRIKNERVCSVDDKPVPWDEIVKGYEYEKGQYVMLTDEDFKKVNPEATQSVDILEFVELDKINPMYFDKPYYLEPTKQGRHAYALLREALAKSNGWRSRGSSFARKSTSPRSSRSATRSCSS